MADARWSFASPLPKAGNYTLRTTSNLPSLNGLQGTVSAVDSDSPGFIKPANVHHWSYLERFVPHLWMGDTCYPFAILDRPIFEAIVEKSAPPRSSTTSGVWS
jgi:hypothetical protein